MKLYPTDLAVATAAVAALPAALAVWLRRMETAAAALSVPEDADLETVLAALTMHTSHADRVSRARDEVARLLADAGVPVRTVAGAMGSHHATVTAMVTRARGERVAEAAEAARGDA
ncbi:Uncharacterised protein [Mycobacteroides abscessus subsp. abscessus]|uniref:hypothetical protein n=1 Tax=Mycobacteroides abscessus TaxID=36809 RepID=UPI00092AD5B9|nr:hypothetical protein [Mycobacteroides abscessus]SIC60677.1 Uncharacterised protein [Mycobacteroides abscessus subsp. abscessus]SKK21358.1 Uncharacterised protein [Mycobacteroides abscessus subsp. abscessus]